MTNCVVTGAVGDAVEAHACACELIETIARKAGHAESYLRRHEGARSMKVVNDR